MRSHILMINLFSTLARIGVDLASMNAVFSGFDSVLELSNTHLSITQARRLPVIEATLAVSVKTLRLWCPFCWLGISIGSMTTASATRLGVSEHQPHVLYYECFLLCIYKSLWEVKGTEGHFLTAGLGLAWESSQE